MHGFAFPLLAYCVTHNMYVAALIDIVLTVFVSLIVTAFSNSNINLNGNGLNCYTETKNHQFCGIEALLNYFTHLGELYSKIIKQRLGKCFLASSSLTPDFKNL